MKKVCSVRWKAGREGNVSSVPACPLSGPDPEQSASLRRCTYAGRPFGNEEFVKGLSEQFGRHWVRGRPRKEPAAAPAAMNSSQSALFAEGT